MNFLRNPNMNKSKKIKLFVMDVDGTLTDGKIYIGVDGEIMKAFSVKDGYGICNILIPSGVVPIIITGRKSKILERRCAELGITDVFQNAGDKLAVLNFVCQKYGASFSEVAYIGDDTNDISCMMKVVENSGLVGCPSDADHTVKMIASYVSESKGGEGAVRDFVNFIFGC